MYAVYKNFRKQRSTFETYEKARQFVRKQIRKAVEFWNYAEHVDTTSNPSIGLYGYQIKKI